MNNLNETIDLMKSEDFKERFKAEYYQLQIRIEKLRNIVDHYDELEFHPITPESTLRMQLIIMEKYLAVLRSRAKLEEIEL